MPLLAKPEQLEESGILIIPLCRTHGMTDSRAPNEQYHGGSKDGLFAERYGSQKVSYGLSSAAAGGAGGAGGGNGNNPGGGNGGRDDDGGGGWRRGTSDGSGFSTPKSSSAATSAATSSDRSGNTSSSGRRSARRQEDATGLTHIPEEARRARVNRRGRTIVVVNHGTRGANHTELSGHTGATSANPAGDSVVRAEGVTPLMIGVAEEGRPGEIEDDWVEVSGGGEEEDTPEVRPVPRRTRNGMFGC